MDAVEQAGWDESTAQAWVSFQARLAEAVLDLEAGEVLLLEAESDLHDDEGAAPYAQFVLWGEDQVRCEVVSNNYLAEDRRLTAWDERRLRKLGFIAPTTGAGQDSGDGAANFHVDADRGDADRLAVLAVSALRDVYGVTHPAMLEISGLGAAGHDLTVPAPHEPACDLEPVASFPKNPGELRSMIATALTPLVGSRPEPDDDGDFGMSHGTAFAWIRAMPTEPEVRIFACVLDHVIDLAGAEEAVDAANRQTIGLDFTLDHGRILATTVVDACPFAPEHLRRAVQRFLDHVDQQGRHLSTRLGGAVAVPDDRDQPTLFDDVEDSALGNDGGDDDDATDVPDLVFPLGDDPDPVESALDIMRHLEEEQRGSLDPSLVAAICRHDRQVILGALRQVEPSGHAELLSLLRRALRRVIESELARRRESRG